MALTEIPSELSSTPSIVDNGNGTAITIDASENVLVGKSSAGGVATVGAEFRGSDGYVIGTASSDKSGWFGRNTSDGAIVGFYKDGTAVGSVGTGSSLLTIGTGTGNLVFADALVAPCSDSSVGSSNGVVDLGASSRRFKDLYLSSGAYLGGTTAANKLEEYEEGTWTPTIFAVGGGTVTGITVGEARYTKVGRNVNIYLYISSINLAQLTTGTYIALGGLPFICNGYSDFNFTYMRGGTNIRGGYAQSASSYIYLCDGNGYEVQQSSNDTVTHMIGACAYITNS